MKKVAVLLLSTVLMSTPFLLWGQEINTILMQSTFKIEGRSSAGSVVGTVFIIGRPYKTKTVGAYVMVTAAHVLDGIKGESATIHLRRKKSDGTYGRVPFEIKIRDKKTPLWVRHNDNAIDIAAMYVSLPDYVEISLLSTDLLANDKTFQKYEIHPGDELLCLGYPYGEEANSWGFPILRSGKIASYPLTPAKTIKIFLYDFQVFEGNSGGPVYFTQLGRAYGGSYRIDEPIAFIAGLVARQRMVIEPTKGLDEYREKAHRLSLAEVVPAHFIKETIDLLPNLDE